MFKITRTNPVDVVQVSFHVGVVAFQRLKCSINDVVLRSKKFCKEGVIRPWCDRNVEFYLRKNDWKISLCILFYKTQINTHQKLFPGVVGREY